MAIEQLGPYRIERLLGRGGMGAVYAGVHQETGERAAIKVLAESLAFDPRFRDRFLGEVDALKRLRHKNIVSLLGFGEEDGTPYFVMDLITGRSLEEELRAGRRFTWRETTDIGVQVCAALKHAHDHGIVHRDLKPGNLLLTPDDTVKLADFGIAKFFGGHNLTLSGSLIGTPDYMSPEQIEGKPATPRSDLYSLGCVLYALLTGKPPFSGPTLTVVMDRVRFETPQPVRSAAPETPQSLDEIVAQLLRKNPDERIATPLLTAKLLQAMAHAVASQEESATDARPGGETTVVASADDALASGVTDVAQPTKLGQRPADAPRTIGATITHAVRPTADLADAGHAETIEYALEHDSPIVDPAQRKTHFTRVSEREWRSAIGVDDRPAPSRGERWSVALWALALLTVVAAVIYLALPPRADDVYRQIVETAAQPDDRDRCARGIAEFLERFPDDPRVAEVERIRADVQCLSLQHELAGKVRALTDLEQTYLEGMDLTHQDRSPEAADRFQRIVDALEPRVLSAADRRLLDRAQHMLRKTRGDQ